MKKPRVGDLVLVTLTDPNESRPAIITRIHDNGDINAQVFADGKNDVEELGTISFVWWEHVAAGKTAHRWRPLD